MDKENSFFRQEALQHKKCLAGRFYRFGAISVAHRVMERRRRFAVGYPSVIHHLCQKSPVTGRVIYTPSAAEAVFNHDGIIGRIEVHQGERVKKGDVIATFSRDVAYVGEA